MLVLFAVSYTVTLDSHPRNILHCIYKLTSRALRHKLATTIASSTLPGYTLHIIYTNILNLRDGTRQRFFYLRDLDPLSAVRGIRIVSDETDA